MESWRQGRSRRGIGHTHHRIAPPPVLAIHRKDKLGKVGSHSRCRTSCFRRFHGHSLDSAQRVSRPGRGECSSGCLGRQRFPKAADCIMPPVDLLVRRRRYMPKFDIVPIEGAKVETAPEERGRRYRRSILATSTSSRAERRAGSWLVRVRLQLP